MKTLPRDIVRYRNQFEHLSYRLRTWLLILASVIVFVSLILALRVFSYIFDLAINPGHAQELVDQWAAVFLSRTGETDPVVPVLAAPSRWFAVFALAVIAFIVTRIPLLLLQMGTQIILACTQDRRTVRQILREAISEAKQDKVDYD